MNRAQRKIAEPTQSRLEKFAEIFHECAFYIWVISACFPTLSEKTFDWDSFRQSVDVYTPNVYPGYAAALFGGISFLWTLLDPKLPVLNYKSWTLLLALTLMLGGIMSAAQMLLFGYLTITTFCVIGCYRLLQSSAERLKRIAMISIVITFFYYIAAFVFIGLPHDRWVGGIHPNIFAASLLLASMMALVLEPAKAVVIFAVATVISIAVEARYALASVAIFAILFFTVHYFRRSISASAALGGIVVVTLLVFFLPTILSNLFLIDDPLRGLGNGISGRETQNTIFYALYRVHPWIGFGFRYPFRVFTPHSGILLLVLQVGPAAALGIFLVYIGGIWEGFAEWRSPSRTMDIRSVFKLAILAMLPLAIFQPQILNLGDNAGISTIWCLSAALCKRPLSISGKRGMVK